MPTALFRTNASPDIGGGHVMRCLTLADALARHGWTCIFACNPAAARTVSALAHSGHRVHSLNSDEDADAQATARVLDSAIDLLVIDHYGLGAAYERAWQDKVERILVVDDLPGRPHACDLLLDQTLDRKEQDYAGLVGNTCKYLLGPSFALTRPAFPASRPNSLARRRSSYDMQRLLLTFGASDVGDCLTLALEGVARAGWSSEVDILVGQTAVNLDRVKAMTHAMPFGVSLHIEPDDVAGLMARADLAISAAGLICWELCCLGVPSLLVVVADNQRDIAAALSRHGAARVLGARDAITPDAIAIALAALAPADLKAMSAAAAELCDGRGVERVSEAILS